MTGKGFLLIIVELLSGVAIGSILATVLINAIDPIIVFIIIIATIIAILDFADYMPAFSLAYFAGYIGEFLYPIAGIFGDLKIPVLVLALIGMGAVVAVKAGTRTDRHVL
jgi:hypothetical protein